MAYEATESHAAPDGWTAAIIGNGRSTWSIEPDDGAPSRLVLKQSSAPVYPVALKDGVQIDDGFVEVGFKTLFGFKNHAAGIVWRAQDACNGYLARADALKNNLVVYKIVDGIRRPLDIVGRAGGYGASLLVRAGRWYTLRVEFAGSRFKISFNGRALFEVEDATFPRSGRVGLWTRSDGATLFDGFAYGRIGGAAARQTVT
jgi:hypothetical protein